MPENVAQSPSRSNADVTQQALRERVKELQAFYGLSEVVEREDVSLEEIYQTLVAILLRSWKNEEITCARVVVGGREFCTDNFAESPWMQSAPVKVNGVVIGTIDVGYLEESPEEDEGPFLIEERRLIDSLAERLGRIIERKQADEKLLFQASLLEAVEQAVIVTKPDGQIIYWNSFAEKLYGWSADEAIGKNIVGLTKPHVSETRSKEILEQIGAGHRGTNEYNIQHRDGAIIPVLVTHSPIYNDEGDLTAIIGASVDLTERKQMEAQSRNTQRLESIGTLAGGVAHEINNPLMGMMNYAELVKDEVQDQKLVDYLTGIGTEGNRIATIVRNLLSFSRQRGESYRPTGVRDIIEKSLSLVGSTMRGDQITIEIDIPEELPQVKCNDQEIQQVVINLLTNAHDALNTRYSEYDENKIIRIAASAFEKDGEPWIRTTVEDHGSGIPEDVAARIFDPFFSTKPRNEGTGLGLSISFGIMSEHAGKLTMESALGEYTRFHMDLPQDAKREGIPQEEAS